jgi:hypothetical protein
MAKNATKQKRIDDITEMIEKGTETKEILRLITENYGTSESTVEKDIKKAKLIVAERNNHKEIVRLEQTTQAIKDAVNEAILSDFEIEGILCKIASGNMHVEQIFEGKPVLRDITPMEVISAAKVIFAKRGSNAPARIAQTNVSGEDLDISKLSAKELASYSVLIKKIIE